MSEPRDNGAALPPGKDVAPADQIGLEAIPGLARVAATAWWHTTEWTAQTGFRAARRLLKAATSPESAATLATDLQETARAVARDLVGITDLEERVRTVAPRTTSVASAVAARVQGPSNDESQPDAYDEPTAELRARGAGLLRQSSDVRYVEEAHPAYARILGELAPDEGRILRLLMREGPQPSVDVRTGGPIGLFSSELIAPGLSMIGPRAGVRYGERVPSYLNNLSRLGMIWFSRETLRDAHRYQVIEAQPDVLEAMHSVRFAKLVRRSIHLTPFGIDFCRDCLGFELDLSGNVLEHSSPAGKAAIPQPPALTE